MIVGSRTVLVKLVPCCVALPRVVVMYSVAGILRMIAEVFLTSALDGEPTSLHPSAGGIIGRRSSRCPNAADRAKFPGCKSVSKREGDFIGEPRQFRASLGGGPAPARYMFVERMRSVERAVALGPAKSPCGLVHQTANGDPDRDGRSIAIVGRRLDACSTIGAKRHDCRAPGRRSELYGAPRCGPRRGRGALP